jgi:hypothetical protein
LLGLAEKGDTVARALLGLELGLSDVLELEVVGDLLVGLEVAGDSVGVEVVGLSVGLATGVVIDPLMQSAVLLPPHESKVSRQHSSLLAKYGRDPGGGRGNLVVHVSVVSYLGYH